jgi:hypothetical protein
MDPLAVPVIKLEVAHMKQSILHAFHAQQLETDEYMRAAIDAYCEPANIRHVIHEAVGRILNTVISEEVRDYYQRGEGREIIREACIQRLQDGTTHSPLDDQHHDEEGVER